MYLPAFPALAADLRVSDAQVQLSLTTCLIGLAVGQLVCGPLSDRWGRRRPLIIGVGAYAIFSFLCALAPTAPVPAGVGRPKAWPAVPAWWWTFGMAPIAAPSFGSAVLKVTSWQGVFIALGGIATLLTALITWRMPETLSPDRRSRAPERHRSHGPHPVRGPDLSSVIAALAAPLIGFGDPGQCEPMALAILSFALMALLSVLTLARPRK
jgi:MFS family permease